MCYNHSGDFMRTCYIIAAGDSDLIEISPVENDIVIACDAGLRHCENNNIVPDVVIGDFDSLGFVPDYANTIVLPVAKDDTDTAYAVKYAMQKGFDRYVVFGAMGGKRPDHTHANIALLAHISKNGKSGFLADKNCTVTALTDARISFPKDMYGDISVFSFDSQASGVTEKGLLYSLENAEIKNTDVVGVSNSFSGQQSSIEVKSGTLIIYFNGKFSDVTIDK